PMPPALTPGAVKVRKRVGSGRTVDASYTGSFSATPSQYGCYFSVSGGALILAKWPRFPTQCLSPLVCTSSSVETLVVNLVDINEFAPAFNPNSFSINVSEAASVSSFVIQLNSYVKDADKSNQDTFNFLLLRLYTLNVSAAELASNPGSLPGPLTGFATVEVRVTDSDDQNPVFVDSGYSLSFMENDSSLLSQQLATQPRNVLNNATFLEINATTGALRLTSVLDRETLLENSHAYQTDKPDLRTAVTFVSVMVSDKNDNKPAMSAASYSASIVENSPNGTFVTQVAATDADAVSAKQLQKVPRV
uniref:Cadherin domain-containing protein n=1 Tax=Macrostomum lignano TaxID=282301 RepID=A0A1I8F2D4_9PLAT